MQINAVSPTAAANSQPAGTVQGSFGHFGSAEFMKILMAQLRHQNPLEPMNDSEMLSQFSQLNSLNELQAMRAAISHSVATSQASYAASLIGKIVKSIRPDGANIEGVVDGVTMENGMLMLSIGLEKVALIDVTEVKGAAE